MKHCLPKQPDNVFKPTSCTPHFEPSAHLLRAVEAIEGGRRPAGHVEAARLARAAARERRAGADARLVAGAPKEANELLVFAFENQ